jgi:hypothetical protein
VAAPNPIRFKTKVIPARYKVLNFTPEKMKEIGTATRDDIRARILSGVNANDANALPLSMKYKEKYDKSGKLYHMGADRGYRAWKSRRFPPPIRNWKLTGYTLDQMQVLSVENNKAVIGFVESIHPAMTIRGKSGNIFYVSREISVNKLVAINQVTEKMFGLSPKNSQDLMRRVHGTPLVTVETQHNG